MEYNLKLNQKEKEYLEFITKFTVKPWVEKTMHTIVLILIAPLCVLSFGHAVGSYIHNQMPFIEMAITVAATLGFLGAYMFFLFGNHKYNYWRIIHTQNGLKKKIKDLK